MEVAMQVLESTPVSTSSSPHPRTLPTELLTPEEVLALMRVCSRRAPTGVRNRALIAVLYRSGLRIAEVLALMPGDLDQEQGTLNVRHGKGDRQRFVSMDQGGWDVLQVWMERRGRLGLNGRHPVFCTLDGRPMQPAYTRSLLPRLARRAGIEKRVHPHGFRHLFAAELYREGVRIGDIQRLLGHASLAVTGAYLARINPQEALDAVRRRTWSADGPGRAA
jgi:site-specific recombinase XerD